MLKHMTIWGLWLTTIRTSIGNKRFVGGHTQSERDAFDRLMAPLRHSSR